MVAVVQNGLIQTTLSSGSAGWADAVAVLYDPFLWVGERAGMRAHREELLSRARGCTVEIGGGTGVNLAYYPDDLDELVLIEPDAAMRARLEKRLSHSSRRVRLVDAGAERLPFADGSVDTVVSTLVLCMVDPPDLALREVARVLRPDGQLLFIVLREPLATQMQHLYQMPFAPFERYSPRGTPEHVAEFLTLTSTPAAQSST